MSSPLLPYFLFAFLGGCIIPIQAIMTDALKSKLAIDQVDATFILYFGGAITSLFFSLIINKHNVLLKFQVSDWWMWASGCIGFFYIFLMFIAFPKLGVSVSILFVFLGQVVLSVAIDHFGLFGMPHHPISVTKLIGLIFILMGAALIMYDSHHSG
ncbi:DMT family transporter [Vibrio penaeicida]|uniref:DMT family transporter n=1 Tax=Vibrio penaeicida TaxID=104609 RepID=UPI000CEA70FD|nr:DMT family transporter [Vibrio penaeicida]